MESYSCLSTGDVEEKCERKQTIILDSCLVSRECLQETAALSISPSQPLEMGEKFNLL